PIRITPDPRDARPYWTKVTDHITSIACSPGGARTLIVARGDVYSVPREHGLTRHLTSSPGSRERGAVWSPDGKRVAYLSDRSGEYQVWVQDAAGYRKPERLTGFPDGYRHTLRWSPDGSRIAFTDSNLALWIVDVATKKLTKVDTAAVHGRLPGRQGDLGLLMVAGQPLAGLLQDGPGHGVPPVDLRTGRRYPPPRGPRDLQRLQPGVLP
ncbi:MAG: hypothetical protein GXP47_12460, partial [Acidobacteria bacterium]|nr:hypothetical protein [Acidobacteriota bacterium]